MHEGAWRRFLVIFRPPGCDLALGIKQILKPAHVQTLFPQARVEALHPPVLRRLSRLNMHHLNLPLHTPGQKMPAGELRSTTSFFNFVFSSRSYFPSFASLPSIPPYFAFHA